MDLELKNPKIFNRKFNWRKQDMSPIFPQRLLVNNEMTTDQETIESSLKSFWENIFTSNKRENICHKNEPWFKDILIDKWKCSLEDNKSLMSEISLEEIKFTITSLSKSKSPGPDGIYSESWIFADEKIWRYLTNIYNLCIQFKTIPEEWKVAKIRLIHKGGKMSPENFRPIALLSSIYKIFTTIINRRLNSVIQQYDLIPEHQSGFYKGRTTASRIWTLISLINHQRLINENLHVLYLDIKKAYDSVEHDYLVETLATLGFPLDFVELIKNIYTNSVASIITNTGTTNPFEISKGVKQGCPLSPTLFSLFIEPLLTWLNESKLGVICGNSCHTVGGFADDLVITTSSFFNMELAFNMICKFLRSYNMELNIDHSAKNKTVYTSFTNRGILMYKNLENSPTEVPFINASECYKYLGININLELNWDKQTIILWNCFQRQINFLCNKCLTTKQVTKILNSIIMPALYYSLQFFNLSIKWATKFERKLALLLSKYLHIPEASPMHYQKPYQDGSFNLAKFKLHHLNLPILSLLRVINSKDTETANTILNSLGMILGDLTIPNGISNIVLNPHQQINGNMSKLTYFLYDYELVNKMSKANITILSQLFENGFLLPFDLLKIKIKNRHPKIKISLEEYIYLTNTLCNENKSLKSSIIEAINNQTHEIPILPPYVEINNRICIFTDASEDEEATAYSIFVGNSNPFNKSENIPFMTNNRAELFAILQTLRRLPLEAKAYIFTDSKLAVQNIYKDTNSDFNKCESLDFIKEIRYLLRIRNENYVLIEHINSHLDNKNTKSFEDKVKKLKLKFPNDWEKIIEGNKNADLLAKLAKFKAPEHKYPPSAFASKLLLISEQGEIIQSNFKRSLLSRVNIKHGALYRKKKPEQNPFEKLCGYEYTKQFDKSLMLDTNFKMTNVQNFLFKLRFNKLLVKQNVIARANKYGYSLNNNYSDSLCPSCNDEIEDLKHIACCTNSEIAWRLNNKKLLSIINSFNIMSKHDIWNENWSPYVADKIFFPLWTDYDVTPFFYDTFSPICGRLGIIPAEIDKKLENFGINKNLRFICIYECYLQIIKTLQKIWNNRCKNFAVRYPH